MKRPVLVALATVVTAILTVLGTGLSPTLRAFAQTDEGTAVATKEMNCYEIQIQRAANLANLRKLVPSKYELLEIVPGVAGRFWFIDYGCKQVSVDDQHPRA